MLETHMDRRRHTGVSLQTLICWTLIGLCLAGHRPYTRQERTRHARHHDRWIQRVQYPSPNDQGTQRIEYPSVNDEGTQELRYPSVQDRGQTVQFPSLDDSGASSQIQVKVCEDPVLKRMLLHSSCRKHFSAPQVWLVRLLSESKGHVSALHC